MITGSSHMLCTQYKQFHKGIQHYFLAFFLVLEVLVAFVPSEVLVACEVLLLVVACEVLLLVLVFEVLLLVLVFEVLLLVLVLVVLVFFMTAWHRGCPHPRQAQAVVVNVTISIPFHKHICKVPLLILH